MERNFGRFVGIVSKYLRLQPADAQDVVQTALLRAWLRVEIIRSAPEAEKWLIACVINQGLDTLKIRKRYLKKLELAGHVKSMRPSAF